MFPEIKLAKLRNPYLMLVSHRMRGDGGAKMKKDFGEKISNV